MPFPSDWTLPSEFLRVPARQPTAATTVPPGTVVSTPPGDEIRTSVTTFASWQVPPPATPAHEPVGRFAFAYVLPPSVDRKRPNDVPAYTSSGFVGSTATANPSAPSGIPVALFHVAPRSVLQKAP